LRLRGVIDGGWGWTVCSSWRWGICCGCSRWVSSSLRITITLGDSVVLRYINPHCVGGILMDSISVTVGIGVGLVLSSILGYIVWVIDGDSLIFSLNFGLGDIVRIGLDIDISHLVGQGVLLGFCLGDVCTLGFCEICLLSVVAILCLLMVVMLGDHLGIIQQLGLSLDLRLRECSHSGIEDDSFGYYYGLGDGGIACGRILLVLGTIVHAGGLDIFRHGFGNSPGVAYWFRWAIGSLDWWGVIADRRRGITCRTLVWQPRG